jgi:hypothetical protein
MLRRVVFLVAVVAAVAALARPAEAWRRHQINATPFFHASHSVFDHRPYTPSFCSVFNHGPCIPEIDYPIGEKPAADDSERTF